MAMGGAGDLKSQKRSWRTRGKSPASPAEALVEVVKLEPAGKSVKPGMSSCQALVEGSPEHWRLCLWWWAWAHSWSPGCQWGRRAGIKSRKSKYKLESVSILPMSLTACWVRTSLNLPIPLHVSLTPPNQDDLQRVIAAALLLPSRYYTNVSLANSKLELCRKAKVVSAYVS